MDESVRVLYVAPETASADAPPGLLGFDGDRVAVETATGTREGLDRLEETGYDCIVAHAALAGSEDVEFLDCFRGHGDDVPFVLFAEDGDAALEPAVSSYLRRLDGDDPDGLLATSLENVDGRRRGEPRSDHRQRLKAITENVPDGIVTIDTDSVIRSANPGLGELFGYSPDELVGETLTAIMPSRFESQHLRAIDDYLETGERSFDWTNVELPGLHRDGREIPLSVSFSEFERDGELFFTGIMRDITQRKRYEERLERQNRRLDEFASVVSHDLQNPLNVAKLRLELAREERDSEHLESIADAHDRMSRLIEDLLAYARTGRDAIEPEPVALSALAARCWDDLETADGTLVAEADGRVLADPGLLRQVLENLVDNAVTHGGDDVTVTVGELDDADGFYVADDGTGIPDDERGEVFEPGVSTADEGTGFGLAIVEDVAATHGWDVTVAESDGGGARFEFAGVEFVE